MKSTVLALVLVGTLAVVAIFALVLLNSGDADVVIGGKNFTEQDVLAYMMSYLVREHTDLSVETKAFLGGTMVCFNALKNNDLQCYAEYTGTGLVSILERDAVSDPNKAYDIVKNEFEDKYKVTWLKPFGFNNAYTLTMRRKQAEQLGIETFSDLADHLKSGKQPVLSAAFTSEFMERDDGYKGLAQAYDLQFAETPTDVAAGRMYQACANGSVDVICAFATDGRIAAFDLVTLTDDKQFFPPYYAAPMVRMETLEKYPELREALNKLAGQIDNATMQQLNYAVDRQDGGKSPQTVAREFLVEKGLISVD